MPHVSFVPLVGTRIREAELLELGMTLPGLGPRRRAIEQLPALGLLTLAGMLPDPWTCSYHAAAQVDEELVETISAERPTVVAISALSASIGEAYALCRSLRSRGIRTVLGGLHASALPEEAARFANSVVVGSGELVWPTVLQDAAHGGLAPVYRTTGRLGTHGWTQPRLDLLGQQPPRFTLQTQRGCPLACDFCGASRLLGPFEEKPLSLVRAELAAIAAKSPRPLVELADDNTFAGTRDAEALLAVLNQANVRYFTECDWRIGQRPALLKGLAASGCVQVLIGIESLIFRYPGMGQKQAELAQVLEAVEQIQEWGVAVNGCFIIGADGETRESLDRLADFLLASPFAEVQITMQTPFPGTGLYRRLRRAGRLLSSRDWSYYTLFDVVYRPDQMTPLELERGFRDLLRTVFSPAAVNRRGAIRRQIMKSRPGSAS